MHAVVECAERLDRATIGMLIALKTAAISVDAMFTGVGVTLIVSENLPMEFYSRFKPC